MFAAGLEIDLALFRQAHTRSLIFGLVTTMVPQVLGTAYGLAFGYDLIPAIVIGSLLASHTLISLPIGCCRGGACGRNDWRHRRIGHTFADRLRDLRLDLCDRGSLSMDLWCRSSR